MNVTPGYPRRNPCLSFWLQHTRNSLLQEHRTTETLPGKADVTIIGSGLSGAATAYFLLTTGPEDKRPKSVVLLEAREACDGATARNGGHCRPDCYRDYRHYKANFGQEQAFKIIQNEMDTLNLTEEIIAKEGIDCDFWRAFTYGVVSGAGIGWCVETDRGVVETEKVVYATSAFTATLLPEFLGHIYPFKGQCSAVVPPKAYAGKGDVSADAYSDYHRRDMQAYGDNKLKAPAIMADYLIQRPDGIIIFGGQRGSVPVERLLGNTDDTHADPERTAALREALPRHFEGWPKEDLAEGEGLAHAWTGECPHVSCFPYVGELQDKPGAFICAGHHGHGTRFPSFFCAALE
ncbi:Fad dependent oxidoreductase [Mycena sanguinolenta]|uniref:Fad dependent oxidoreductase n=1 Tax=Mycena sanguinolenta TaxID=230812 RepID=A0A8H6X5B6_9AGAR|nr:Fad dependent oxidoreductase [Mycena sanguinolenta]